MRKQIGMALAAVMLILATAGQALAEEEIRARADRVTGQIKGKGQEMITLEGNVVIRQGKTVIEADLVVYDKTAGSMVVTGHVLLTQDDVEVEADKLIYQRQTKQGTFLGQVHLSRLETKDASGNVTKDGFSLTSDELAIDVEKKSFKARGRANLVHKDFTALAEEMDYDDEHQELILKGQPSLTHKDEVIKAEQIAIAVEADTFTLNNAEITFQVEQTQEKKEPSAESATTGGSKPPAP